MAIHKKYDVLSAEARLVEFERELRQLNRLLRVTLKRALAQDDSAAFGHLYEKLAARKSSMLGLDSPTRTDINLLATVKRVSTVDALQEAIDYLASQGEISAESQQRIRANGYLPEPPEPEPRVVDGEPEP